MLLRSLLSLSTHGTPAADDSAVQTLFGSANGSFAKTVIGHLQRHPGARFSVVALDLASQPVGSTDEVATPLTPALYAAFMERLRSKWYPKWREDRLDRYIGLLLPDADQDLALQRLRDILVESCRYSILADRECHAIRWRFAVASYPSNGHAPWRLLRHAAEQVRESDWSAVPVAAIAGKKAA